MPSNSESNKQPENLRIFYQHSNDIFVHLKRTQNLARKIIREYSTLSSEQLVERLEALKMHVDAAYGIAKSETEQQNSERNNLVKEF